jgi:hypothetical protein
MTVALVRRIKAGSFAPCVRSQFLLIRHRVRVPGARSHAACPVYLEASALAARSRIQLYPTLYLF